MIMITAMFTGSQHRDLGNALARGLGAWKWRQRRDPGGGETPKVDRGELTMATVSLGEGKE